MIKVIYLMGQSNAEGDAILSEMDARWLGFMKYAKYWEGSAFESVEINAGHSWNMGSRVGEHGLQPHLSQVGWGLRVDEVYIVPAATGGTGLDSSYGEWWPSGGTTYSAFSSTVSAVDTWFSDRGLDYEVTHIIWIQGEKDASNETNAGNYASNFGTLKTSVDSLFSSTNSDDPFWLVVKLSSNFVRDHLTTLRAQQDTIGSTYADVEIVNSDDCEVNSADNIHFTADGFETLGPRIVDLILEDYGVPTRYNEITVGAGGTFDVWDHAYSFENGVARFLLNGDTVNNAISGGEFTLCFAYKPDAFDTTNTAFVCWNTTRSFWVRFRSSGSSIQAITSADGTTTGGIHTVAHGMTIGTWYFWTVVVSMSEGVDNDRIKIYRNGVDLSATVTTGNHNGGIQDVPYVDTTESTRDETTYKWGGSSSASSGLNGFAHEFTVIDTALSAAQVSAIYNSGTPISPRDNHNANVVSRVDTSSLAWDGTNYDGDDEILGTGSIEGLNTVNGDLSSTGGIY